MTRPNKIVAGEPRLRILHHVFILSGCRDSRGHLNRYADCLGLMRNLQENEQLLTGLAFENLIKGILIQRDTTLVTWEKIESGILPRGGHGISSRAKKILNLAPREFNLLQRIEEYLFWAGRYPLPLKSGIYHNSEVQELRSGRSDDPPLIDALFQRLIEILRHERRKRKP